MRILLLAILPVLLLRADDRSLETVHRIKDEAFDRSKVMEILTELSDQYGPRLTGSREFDLAAEWALAKLKSYGLENVHTEKWGPFGHSWSLESYTCDMTEPRYSHLAAVPLAWSGPTGGVKTGEAIWAPLHVGMVLDVKKNREYFETYKTKYHGRLRGKVVLMSEAKPLKPAVTPLFHRLTDADLQEIAKAPQPSTKRDSLPSDFTIPDDPEEAGKLLASLPFAAFFEIIERYFALTAEEAKFFRQEGALAVFRADDRAHNALDFAEGATLPKDAAAAPTFVVTQEQYTRMTRLVEKGQTVRLKLALEARVSPENVDSTNLVGEIRGKSKPDEVVMIGAHFDSWHSSTGTTDNGAGSAVMMEVMRILKKLDIKLDRTVRIALWSGEEQGLLGSRAYVKEHFGDEKDKKPEHAKLSAYLNLDNGSGKIRGVYLEGNDRARPLFESWLSPFRDLGVTTVTLKHTGGTDHEAFDAVGLPGFQFIQDSLDYGTVTHHSNADTVSHAVPEDLMQASAVIADLVVEIANREGLVPRKE